MAKRKTLKSTAPVSAPLLVFDLTQLSKALNLSKWTCRRLIEIGEIPAISLPAVSHAVRRRDCNRSMKRILVRVADVQAYLDKAGMRVTR